MSPTAIGGLCLAALCVGFVIGWVVCAPKGDPALDRKVALLNQELSKKNFCRWGACTRYAVKGSDYCLDHRVMHESEERISKLERLLDQTARRGEGAQ